MSKRVVVVFAGNANAEGVAIVTRLRQQFDPLADLVEPHITLVFPFESEMTDLDLRAHIKECARKIAPFPVRLSQVTGNEGEYIFLNVKQGNDQLIALHDLLYTGPLEGYLSRENTYCPHMTVGRLSDTLEWQAAVKIASATSVSLDFVVKDVALYSIEPTGNRQVSMVIPLGSH